MNQLSSTGGPARSDGGGREASVLVLLVWLWVVAPRTIQTLTAPKYRTQVGTEAPPYTALASASLTLTGLAVLLFCVLVIIGGLKNNPSRLLSSLVVLLLPWTYLQLRSWTLGQPVQVAHLMYPMVLTALWILRPGVRQLRLLGYLSGAVALMSVAIGALLPAQGILRRASGLVITEEKSILPWGILVGIFTHGNNLGQFLVLSLPLVACVRRPSHRVALLAVTLFALVWSAARSCLLTAVVLTVSVALLRLVLPRARRAVAYLVLLVAWGVVVLVPLLTRDPLAFTNRGYIWGVSLQVWQGEPWLGWGARYYAEIARTSGNLGGTVFHGHNQLVQLLVTGGLVAVAMVVLMIVTLVRRAGRQASLGGLFGVAFLIALAGSCLLEVSLVFVDNLFLFPLVVIPMAVIGFGGLEAGEVDEGAVRPAAAALPVLS